MTLELPGGLSVLGCHFPYRGNSQDDDRYRDHRPTDEGAWLRHGHVHERWRQRGRMINIGVDAWGGHPVTDNHLAKMIAEGENDVRPLSWTRP